MNIKLDAGEAIQQIKELAVNTGELKDRKKELNTEISNEEKALKALQKLQAEGINVDKQLLAQEEKLARVRKENREEIALIDTALRGNSGRMRELTNDVSKLTDENLRFRDKMADAFSDAAEQVIKPLRVQIREARLEAQKAFDAFGEGSEEFRKAAERVDDLDDKQKALNRRIQGIDAEGKVELFGKALQGVAGAFSLAQGAAALFGNENKAVEEALLKVQAAMAIQQGISGLVEGAKAAKALAQNLGLVGPAAEAGAAGMRAMSAATIATGIGAIVVAVGTLVTGIMAITSAAETAKQAQQELIDKGREALRLEAEGKKALLDSELRLKVLRGEMSQQEAQRQQNTRNFNQEQAQREADINKSMQQRDELGAKIAANEGAINTLLKSRDPQLQAQAARLKEENASLEIQKRLADETAKAQQRAAEDAKQELNNRNEALTIEEANAASQKKASDESQRRVTTSKQAADNVSAEAKAAEQLAQAQQQGQVNAITQFNQYLQEREAAETAYFNSFLTQQQLEEQAVRDKYFNLIAEAEKYGEDTKVLEEARAKEIADINAKYAEAAAETNVTLNTAAIESSMSVKEQLAALDTQYAEQSAALKQEDYDSTAEFEAAKESLYQDYQKRRAQIQQEGVQQTLSVTAGLFGALASLSKKNSTEQKAFAIGEAIINTYLGATKALATLPPPASYIAVAATIASGLASVAKIAGVGFADGGYTGAGGKYEPAGVVHRGEYVLPQEVVSAIGVDRLDALRSMYTSAAPGRGRYATGGLVTPTLDSSAIFAANTAAEMTTMQLQPVLPVESLRTVMNRVEVREERSTL